VGKRRGFLRQKKGGKKRTRGSEEKGNRRRTRRKWGGQLRGKSTKVREKKKEKTNCQTGGKKIERSSGRGPERTPCGGKVFK